jgi:hypothetical protein
MLLNHLPVRWSSPLSGFLANHDHDKAASPERHAKKSQ